MLAILTFISAEDKLAEDKLKDSPQKVGLEQSDVGYLETKFLAQKKAEQHKKKVMKKNPIEAKNNQIQSAMGLEAQSEQGPLQEVKEMISKAKSMAKDSKSEDSQVIAIKLKEQVEKAILSPEPDGKITIQTNYNGSDAKIMHPDGGAARICESSDIYAKKEPPIVVPDTHSRSNVPTEFKGAEEQ